MYSSIITTGKALPVFQTPSTPVDDGCSILKKSNFACQRLGLLHLIFYLAWQLRGTLHMGLLRDVCV